MPYSPEHKQKSREQILQSAVELFSRQGYAQTSIDEIMQHAKLTRGAFYAHFASKSELYQQALLAGALNSRLVKNRSHTDSQQDWVREFIQDYLSVQHVEQETSPCPMAFLVTDVAISEPEVRHTYTRIFQRMVHLLERKVQPFYACESEEIEALCTLLIGAVAIGRSLDNRRARTRLLNRCQRMAVRLLGDSIELRPRVRKVKS